MQTRCREIQEAKNSEERNLLWQGRRGAFGAVARLAPNYLVNDATVPRTKLPEALAKVAEISKNYNCEHGNVFHAGDGNLHPLLLFDSRDTDQLQRVEKAGWEIMEACVKLGGTISGEHGIGLAKRRFMEREFGLVVGEPAVFQFLASTTRKDDQAGQIVEDWAAEDELGMMRQLGAIP